MILEPKQDDLKRRSYTPLLLRIISIAILAEGLLGMVFFVTAGIFQLIGINFIGEAGLNGFNSYFYSFYIILHIVIFCCFILSGIFLLSQRKIGLYLFIISYLTLFFTNLYTDNTFGWAAIVVGLGFFGALAYFYKKLK